MCEVLEVNQRDYYQWKKQEEKSRIKREKEIFIVDQVRKAFYDNNEVYGSRKLKRYLESCSITISEWKMRRIMRENGLYSIVKTKYKPCTSKSGNERYSSNLLEQNFYADKPNQIWVGDITYIKTKLGWFI